MEYGEPMAKKFKHSIVSEHIFEREFQMIFRKNWHGSTAFRNSQMEIIAQPFRVCKISNFLKSEEFMDELKNELIDVKSRRNSIDLYQFEQSEDLYKSERVHIKSLCNSFQTELLVWMYENTEILLNETISMSSSCYSDTDYLLCHDDNLGDRRIAFILYLSKNWSEEDGGSLDLFDTDEDGLPRNVVKSLIPEYNSLVLFEVVNNSYHQVAEVTSPVKSRWSINGWFHGPVVRLEKPQRPEPVIDYFAPECNEVDLTQWISNNYLFQGLMKEIQEDVEQDSFTFLSEFLKDKVYRTLSAEITSPEIEWRKVGPADVRNYEVADLNTLPETLTNFCQLFKTVTVFELLKRYTGLDLLPETVNMNPRVTIELQRWSKGCYTLITDRYNNMDSSVKSCSPTTNKRDYGEGEAPGGESSLPPDTKQLNNDMEECEASGSSLQEETGCNTPPSSHGDDEREEEQLPKKRRAKDKSSKKKKKEKKKMSESAAESADSPVTVELEASNRERRNHDAAASADSPGTVELETCGKADGNCAPVAPAETPAQVELEASIGDDKDYENRIVSDIEDYLSDPNSDYGNNSDQADDNSDQVKEPGSLDVIMQFHTDQLEKQTIDYVDPREEEAALIHVPSKDNHLCLVYHTIGTCRVHKYINHYVHGYFYNLVCTYFE